MDQLSSVTRLRKCALLGIRSLLYTRNTHVFLCFLSPVLSEAQQKLLVKSMEKKILPVQLRLVRNTAFAKESWEGTRRCPCGPGTMSQSACAPSSSQPLSFLSVFLPLRYFTTGGGRVDFWL